MEAGGRDCIPHEHVSTHNIHIANVAVAAPTVATILGYLPVALGLLATLLAIVVYGLQIYEWFEKRAKERARIDRLADAKADKIASTVAVTAAKLKDSTEKLIDKLDAQTSAPPKE